MSGSVLTCTIDEARQRLGETASGSPTAAPALAQRLRQTGVAAVVILVPGSTSGGNDCCWIDTPHARGWLTPARIGGAGVSSREVFESELAKALARGFVPADAAVLAMMAAHTPGMLPLLSWGEQPATPAAPAATPLRRLDLYAIVDSAARLRQVLAAGVKTVQLRIKTPDAPDRAWDGRLRDEIAQAVADSAQAGAELFINDHWQLASELGSPGVHLGQEDLLALGEAGRATLQQTGMALGISSHSLWELCRARVLAPRYIACGPVWPTLTKAMPWIPQGLDNLAWWCRMAQVPVVAIGGVLGPPEVRAAAAAGADGVCIVRGLGEQPERLLPAFRQALEEGRAQCGQPAALPAVSGGRSAAPFDAPDWPHPTLPAEAPAPGTKRD